MAREQDGMMHRGIGMTSERTRERLIQRLREEGIVNQNVLEVIRRTPRHLFVDEALAHRAYEDTALPIGNNQTISQPYMVARMSELLLEDGPRSDCWSSTCATWCSAGAMAGRAGQRWRLTTASS